MDIGNLKKQSDLSYDIAIAKRNELEKAHSRQILVYNEHIFHADADTICLVKTLKDVKEKFFVLDTNKNPVDLSPRTQVLDLARDIFLRMIMRFGLKCVHVARYGLIFKHDGATWLRITFKPHPDLKKGYKTKRSHTNKNNQK